MKRSFFLLTTLLIVSLCEINAQTYYARQNGDWDQTDRWSTSGVGGSSCSCTPTPGSTVIIDGYDIDIDANTGNVSVGSISVTNARNANAHLRLQGGITLTVTSNFDMYTSNNRDRDVELFIEDDNTTMNVNGTFTMTRSASDTRNQRLTLDMSDNSDLNITGLFNLTNYRSSNSQNQDEIELNNEATLNCNGGVAIRQDNGGDLIFDLNNSSSWNITGDMDFDINGGDHTDFNLSNSASIDISDDLTFDVDNSSDDIEFRLSGSSSITVDDDATFDMDGGEDIEFYLSNSSGSDHFRVKGDLLFDHDGGDGIEFNLSNSAEFDVDGNLTIDWDNVDANNSDVEFILVNNSIFDIDGTLDVNMNETVRSQCDLIVDFDNNGAMYVGVNNGALAHSATFNLVDGVHFLFDLDGDSKLEVYGNCSFIHDGDGNFHLHLNENNNGFAADGQLRVDGNMVVTKNDGDNFQLVVKNHSDMDIGGDLNVSLNNYDVNFINSEIEVFNDGTIDVDGSLNVTHNYTNNSLLFDIENNGSITVGVDNGLLAESATINFTDGYGLDFDLDHDASFTVHGNLIQTFGGDEHCEIHLNQNVNGSTTDGQLRIDGNWNFTKTDGDDFEIYVRNHSDIDVGGNIVFNTSGFDAGPFSHGELHLFNDATLDCDGSFTWTFNSAVEENNLNIDLENSSRMNIGMDNGSLTHSMTINMLNGYDFDFDLDHDARMDVYGNMTIDFAAGTYLDIGLNSNHNGSGADAQLRIDGNLTITKTDGRQFRIFAYNDADIDIGGNFTYTGTNHKTGWWNDEEIRIRNSATMDVDGEFNFSMNTLAQQNSLLFDLNNDAQLSVGSNSSHNHSVIMHNGEFFRIRLDQNSVWNVDGNLQVALNNSSQAGDIGLNRSSGSNAQLNITGNFDIDNNKNTDEFDIRLNGGNSLLNVDGNIDLSSAAASNRIEIQLNSSSKLEIGGSFIRTGGFGELECNHNSTVEYNGTNSQVFAQDAGTGTDDFEYNNVIINNISASIPQLSMEGLATIPTGANITFTDGVIESSVANLLVINHNATASGASSNSYVDGPVQKIGHASFSFPIGDDSVYAPIVVDPTAGTTTAFRCQYFYSPPVSQASLAVGINNVSQKEYWNVDRVVTTNNARVTLFWDTTRSGLVTNHNELMVSHFTGGTWVNAGANSITGNNAAGSVQSDVLTSFSPFSLGSSSTNNPLPVELTQFKATANVENKTVDINWSTSSELNNNYFTVEKSQDLIHFEEVATVSGNGTTNETNTYSTIDQNPFEGVSYYRLSQTDFNGDKEYFEVQMVNFNSNGVSANAKTTLYPNPNSGSELFIEISNRNLNDLQISVYDFAGTLVGQEYTTEQTASSTLVKLKITEQIKAGNYLVKINGSGLNEVKKLVVLD